MRPIRIIRGKALIDGALTETGLTIDGGRIAVVGEAPALGALTIDAGGLLVLPGIVDIHGDAFERQIMPRPGVLLPYPLALTDTDRQLAAAGVTTAYHGLTLSWESGLRSVEGAVDFLRALACERPSLVVDHRVQLRLETFALEAEDAVRCWLRSEPRPTLAFNDHTTTMARKLAEGQDPGLGEWAKRAGMSEESYRRRQEEAWQRRSEVPAFVERTAAEARAAGVVMLSHDDRTEDDRAFYRNLGATIAEFPLTAEAIEDAHRRGEPTVLGAPNVVRGGSHTDALSAGPMVDQGRCTILASDYHYPSMAAAMGRLIECHGQKLEQVWPLISSNPAKALGLDDRGRIETDLRADLLLVDVDRRPHPLIVATIAGGKLAFLCEHDRLI